MVARSWTRPLEDWPGLDEWAEGSLVMAERADDVILARAEDVPEGDWYRGHCFTDGWHLRWRRLGRSVRVVGLGPVPIWSSVPETSAEQSLEEFEADLRTVTLWGKRQPGEAMWLELRIPNIMQPPTQHPADHQAEHRDELLRRVLHVVTYKEPDTGRAAFHRYLGLGYARSDDEETTFDVLDHPATT